MKTFVAGCSKGIGQRLTQQLIADGHSVLGVSRTRPTDLNERFEWRKCDLSAHLEVNEFCSDVSSAEFDNFIYCAGINEIKDAVNLTYNDVYRILDVNLVSFILLSSWFAASRSVKKPSAIIGIGSIWSSWGLKGRSIYGASKGGMVSYAKHLSYELVENNCLVNVVSPGFTRTGLTAKTQSDPLIISALSRQRSSGLLDANDVARHIIQLIRPYNNCISGQEIFVDHGFSSHA